MYDDIPDSVKSTIMDGAQAVAERYGKRPPAGASILRGKVDAANGDGTLDVALDGVVLESVPATIACSGAKSGDTVVVERMGGLLIATGVIATAPNQLATSAELEEVRDSLSQTDWEDIYRSSDKSQRVSYRRVGSTVELDWHINQETKDAWTVGKKIPDGFRPDIGVYFSGCATNSSGYAVDHVSYCWVGSDGTVIFQSPGASAGMRNYGRASWQVAS